MHSLNSTHARLFAKMYSSFVCFGHRVSSTTYLRFSLFFFFFCLTEIIESKLRMIVSCNVRLFEYVTSLKVDSNSVVGLAHFIYVL